MGPVGCAPSGLGAVGVEWMRLCRGILNGKCCRRLIAAIMARAPVTSACSVRSRNGFKRVFRLCIFFVVRDELFGQEEMAAYPIII